MACLLLCLGSCVVWAYGVPVEGSEQVHVFTYCDTMQPALCHLARSVEAAGGILHLLGIEGKPLERDSTYFRRAVHAELARARRIALGVSSKLDFGDTQMARVAKMKAFFFLEHALRRLPGNALVVYVDGLDVLFQRPLSELAEEYYNIVSAGPRPEGTLWPVVIAGERNCYPFPHSGKMYCNLDASNVNPPRCSTSRGANLSDLVYKLRSDAFLSDDYRTNEIFNLTEHLAISGKEVCATWFARKVIADFMSRRGQNQESRKFELPQFPFLNSGAYVGTVASMRRLIRHLEALRSTTLLDEEQSLMTLLLLQNESLAMVDMDGRITLSLHGYSNHPEDLERDICRQGYFRPRHTLGAKSLHGAKSSPVVSERLLRFKPPGFHWDNDKVPMLLHFNGNGKRYRTRCIEEFQSVGILDGDKSNQAECRFWNVDSQRFESLVLEEELESVLIAHA